MAFLSLSRVTIIGNAWDITMDEMVSTDYNKRYTSILLSANITMFVVTPTVECIL